MAEQFDMYYIDENGEKKRPYIIHRTSIGCYERTLAWLIEKYAGIVPDMAVSWNRLEYFQFLKNMRDYADKVNAELVANGIRVAVWINRSEKIGLQDS